MITGNRRSSFLLLLGVLIVAMAAPVADLRAGGQTIEI
jgi:hypothetical protein